MIVFFTLRLSSFFRLREISSEKLLMSPKGLPSFFVIFYHRTDNKKSQRVPLIFFSTMRLYKNIILCLFLCFLRRYPPKLFSILSHFDVITKVKSYLRIFDVISELYGVLLKRRWKFKNVLPFVPARYIRTFAVLSEVICILMKRRGSKKALAFVSARYIRISEAFSEYERYPLCASKLFIKTSWAYF